MEIVVKVDWIEKNFVASIASKDLGAVIVTDKTEQGVKNKFADAFDFHTEGKFEGVKFVYEYSVSAKLQIALQYTTLAVLSRITGIKHAQLSHYANSVSIPRKPQYDKIMYGIHTIGKNISAI